MAKKLIDKFNLSSKQKKRASAATAAALAAAILLSGTFAWQSISQTAKNQASGYANPGGRLHDYFDGENKDVFVENFTDPDDNGVPIFARIRLDEYMEIGEGAGTDLTNETRPDGVTVIGKESAKINDPSTWITHLPGHLPGGEPGNTHTPMHEYWEWEMGGKTVYMPTFNKDQDSLDADINGTYEGPDNVAGPNAEMDNVDDRYEDYQVYGNAYDEEGELQDPVPDNGDVIYSVTDYEHYAGGGQSEDEVTHYGKETTDGKVITMEEWLDLPEEEQIGAFWVYDNDGWAYWAQPIEPGETTGLLLNSIKPQREPDEEWYYAINVVGQFATAGDWGDKESETGFYEDGMTENGEHLLNKVADRLPEVTHMLVEGGFTQYVAVGDSLTLKANMDVKNPTGDPKETYVEWSCEDAGTALVGNTFTPTEDMVGKTYKITATSALTPEISTYVDVIVLPKEAAGTGGEGGGAGVVEGELDGKLYINFGDNTYKEIQANGSLGPWKCAGLDETIGNNDDRTDVVVTEQPTQYGVKFLGPVKTGNGEYYLAAGNDGKVGTADDIKVVSQSTFPNDLTTILATSIEITVPEEITGDSNRVKPGKYYNLSAVVKNGSADSIIQDITWSLEGGTAKDESTRITQDGFLYIGGNEPEGTTLTVQVKTADINGDALTKTVTFTVRDWELSDLMSVPTATRTTVEIDGVDYYLLARNGDQGLLWAKNSVLNTRFGSTNQYQGSSAQSALNTWLDSQSTLKELAQEHTIYTRAQYNSQDFVTSANQKVFLLSEADLFGTFNGRAAQPNDYTYNGTRLVAADNPVRSVLLSSNANCWLRSPGSRTSYVAALAAGGSLSSSRYNSGGIGLRPALWINLAS